MTTTWQPATLSTGNSRLERLAFLVHSPFEADLAEIHAKPLPIVIRILTSCATVADMYDNLPDLEAE